MLQAPRLSLSACPSAAFRTSATTATRRRSAAPPLEAAMLTPSSATHDMACHPFRCTPVRGRVCIRACHNSRVHRLGNPLHPSRPTRWTWQNTPLVKLPPAERGFSRCPSPSLRVRLPRTQQVQHGCVTHSAVAQHRCVAKGRNEGLQLHTCGILSRN
jgi:hypothetical protein